ncbi:MAG: hypothetical protein L3K52_02380 [Candidatus Thiothrix sulfatifontis]|nr:MAG: hypothetical protein L3K52_02380 [Candidatus Thiothrix sulfatifontis]
MPNIPSDPSIIYIAILLLLIGLFLFVSGLDIISVEKITVSKGFKTWFVGLILMISGAVLMVPKIELIMKDDYSSSNQKIISPISNSIDKKDESNVESKEVIKSSTETLLPKKSFPAESPVQKELISKSMILAIKRSKKTHVYNGTWSGVSSKMYIEWEDYLGENGAVKGFIETSGGEIIEAFKGKNYAFRKLQLSLSDESTVYLSATVDGDIKTWHAQNIKFSHKYK